MINAEHGQFWLMLFIKNIIKTSRREKEKNVDYYRKRRVNRKAMLNVSKPLILGIQVTELNGQ